MKYFVATLTISIMFFIGCSMSSLKKIDIEKIKNESASKKEDLKKIQEKIKKLKKKI